jgi:TadE-like protein
MLMAPNRSPRAAKTRNLASLWRRFAGDGKGSVLSELALVMPILVAILMGGVEVGRYLMIHQKLSRLVDTTTDLVAQKKTLTSQDLDDVFKSAEYVLDPFELGPDGVIFITSVTAPTSQNPKVDWQYSGAGSSGAISMVGIPGETPNLPDGFTLDDGENVIIGEIFYDYRPQIFEVFTSPKQLYYRVIDRPRFGPLTQLN